MGPKSERGSESNIQAEACATANLLLRLFNLDSAARTDSRRVGGESQIVSEDAAHNFTARFPDGRWINIKGAGHNVQEDDPRDLADALRAFWGGRLRSMTLKGIQ
jgi:pimeloyl-ACP methyl ester carboxylesterase